MLILKYFLVFVLLLILGLVVEKIFHPTYGLADLSFSLKSDLSIITKIIFTTQKPRHTFDIPLGDELIDLVRPYAHKKFKIYLELFFMNHIPTIGIRFTPEHLLDEPELLRLSQLIDLKFCEYLESLELQWQHFVSYSVSDTHIDFYIQYAEWKSDLPYLLKGYKRMAAKNISQNRGFLIDNDLEMELKNIEHQSRI